LPTLFPSFPYPIRFFSLRRFPEQHKGVALVSAADAHVLIEVANGEFSLEFVAFGFIADGTDREFLELHLDLVLGERRNVRPDSVSDPEDVFRVDGPAVFYINELFRWSVRLENLRPGLAGNAVARRPVPTKSAIRENIPKQTNKCSVDSNFIQKVTGKFLFYPRLIDIPMLHALNDIKSAKNTQATKYFLNYVASNANAEII
jgi:hypothetical protein